MFTGCQVNLDKGLWELSRILGSNSKDRDPRNQGSKDQVTLQKHRPIKQRWASEQVEEQKQTRQAAENWSKWAQGQEELAITWSLVGLLCKSSSLALASSRLRTAEGKHTKRQRAPNNQLNLNNAHGSKVEPLRSDFISVRFKNGSNLIGFDLSLETQLQTWLWTLIRRWSGCETIRGVLVQMEHWALPENHLVEKNLLLLAFPVSPLLILFDCGCQRFSYFPLHFWLGTLALFLQLLRHLSLLLLLLLLPWLDLPCLPPCCYHQKLLPILKLPQTPLFLVPPHQLLVWWLNSPVEVDPWSRGNVKAVKYKNMIGPRRERSLREWVDRVEGVRSQTWKVGFEVQPQASTCCVHLSTEVTPVQTFLGIRKPTTIEQSIFLTCMAFPRCGFWYDSGSGWKWQSSYHTCHRSKVSHL